MDTPLYDELVVKYYLSRGIQPFSYPHEFIRRADKGVSIRKDAGPVTFDLAPPSPRKYDYFRL